MNLPHCYIEGSRLQLLAFLPLFGFFYTVCLESSSAPNWLSLQLHQLHDVELLSTLTLLLKSLALRRYWGGRRIVEGAVLSAVVLIIHFSNR